MPISFDRELCSRGQPHLMLRNVVRLLKNDLILMETQVSHRLLLRIGRWRDRRSSWYPSFDKYPVGHMSGPAQNVVVSIRNQNPGDPRLSKPPFPPIREADRIPLLELLRGGADC